MRDEDKTMFADAMVAVYEVYGKPAPAKSAIRMWWDTLKEFDHNDVFTAINYWPQQHSRPPVPADIWKTLNEQRMEKLEAKAAAERQENRGPLNWSGPTPTGLAALKAIKEMLAKLRRDPLQTWHTRIAEKLKAGEPVPYYSMRCAAEAFEHDGKENIAASIRRRMSIPRQDSP